ncbi:MAG: hypothetical protein EXQ85_02330 [Alphaproteobacteria bacterium]|nr:hypothetical protein [Alphaproteobacteria bacterium]
MRILRQTDDGALRSAIVEWPRGWSSEALVPAAGHQGYLIAGAFDGRSSPIPPGSFFFDPSGHLFAWRARSSVRLLRIFNGPPRFEKAERPVAPVAGAIAALHPNDVAVTLSLVDGRPTGVIRRVLGQDPATGADTRYLTVPAGVSGQGAEYHPCNEEILCLSRDHVVGDPSPLKSGCFLFNPAYGVHGGSRTANAARMTLLEWHDGPWELCRHGG